MADVTEIGQHPRGARFDVQHACPACPTPLAAFQQMPNPFCRWCQGTGLVTTAMLAAWQRHALETTPT